MDKIATWAVGYSAVAVTVLVVVRDGSILLVGQRGRSALRSTWLLALGLAMNVEWMCLHLICLSVEIDKLRLVLIILLHVDSGTSRCEADLIDLVNLNLEVLYRVSPFLFG